MQRVYRILEAFESGQPMEDILADFKAAFSATDQVPPALEFPLLSTAERDELLERLQILHAALDAYTRELHDQMNGIAAQIRMVRRVLPARLAYAKSAHLAGFKPERRN